MIGSSTPLAERYGYRPPHTSALLREALLNSAAATRPEPQEAPPPAFSTISYPKSLAARLNAIAVGDDAVAGGFTIGSNLLSRETFRTESGGLLQDLAAESGEEGEGTGESASDEPAEDMPPQFETTARYTKGDIQALVRDFRRRQRQAGLFVAGCLATAALLTIAGILLLASFTSQGPARAGNPAPHPSIPASKHAASTAWPKARLDGAVLGRQFASVTGSRAVETAVRTSRGENTKTAARLKILASLPAIRPSG